MNKKAKGCLKISGIIALIVLILFCVLLAFNFYWDYRAKVDYEKYSIECNANDNVTEQPEIWFDGFKTSETLNLKFSILRNGQIVQDTVLKNDISNPYNELFYPVRIPFNHFLKTDTIVVETKGGLHYYISDFQHDVYLMYTMFGYRGMYECRFTDELIINGVKTSHLVKYTDR